MMKKPIFCALTFSALLAVTTTMICYIVEAHKGTKRLSEAGFYSAIFCLALLLSLAIILPIMILSYKHFVQISEINNKLNNQVVANRAQLTEIINKRVVLKTLLHYYPRKERKRAEAQVDAEENQSSDISTRN